LVLFTESFSMVARFYEFNMNVTTSNTK